MARHGQVHFTVPKATFLSTAGPGAVYRRVSKHFKEQGNAKNTDRASVTYISAGFRRTILLNAKEDYMTVPPLWSSGQSFWLHIQRSLVRFPALPDVLRSRGSGTGATQPREDN
jgi:hypothetical protein